MQAFHWILGNLVALLFTFPLAFALFLVLLVLSPIWLTRLVRRIPRKKRLPILGGLVMLIVIGEVYIRFARAHDPRPLQFDGESSSLERTQIVPTLHCLVEPGNNVIWCASFQAAWKKLQMDVVKEPVALAGAEAISAALNDSPMPEVPEGELYAAAGWENEGIVAEIQREKQRLFPGSARPEFPGLVPGSFVAYGYIQSACKFTVPYFDSANPVEFNDSEGNATTIRTFGIRPEDDYAYNRLRSQVEVLYAARRDNYELEQFALDLCRDSEPVQVVFARVPLAASLAETLATLEQKIATHDHSNHSQRFGSNDVLLVPEIAYRLVHEFEAIKGKKFENETMKESFTDVMQQEIMFRLDKSGAELISEAKMYARPMSSHYVADGPFLIYLKKRGASSPYFVMWVDNDELLTKWPAGE